MMREAVEHRGRHFGIAEDAGRWELAGSDHRSPRDYYTSKTILAAEVTVTKCVSSAWTGAIFVFRMFETARHFAAP